MLNTTRANRGVSASTRLTAVVHAPVLHVREHSSALRPILFDALARAPMLIRSLSED